MTILSISWAIPGPGSGRCTIADGLTQATIPASYLSDAPRAMLHAVASVVSGAKAARFHFTAEPGAHRWLIHRYGEFVDIEVRFMSDARDADGDGHLVWDTRRQPVADLAKACIECFAAVRESTAPEAYERSWGFAFPELDLAMLERAVASLHSTDRISPNSSATVLTGSGGNTGKLYTATDIKVVSFEDSVRTRTGMYFAVAPSSPDLPTNIVRGVIDDALHSVGHTRHHTVDIEITADLHFTVTDDQPPTVDDASEPMPGFYGSLIEKRRWALAAAAALSSHTLVEVQLGGRGWRQELTGATPHSVEQCAAAGKRDGTRVTFQLDASFIATGAAITTESHQLPPRGKGCPACANAQWADTLTVQDRRLSALRTTES